MELNYVIEMHNINHYYGKGSLRKQTLFDINLTVKSGEIVILSGPSGSGKTTLLTLIAGLRSIQQGSIKILGTEIFKASNQKLLQLRRQLGYIFQDHNLVPFLNAVQNVETSLLLNKELSKKEIRRKAEIILEEVGLGQQMYRNPNQLSGGQKQRVAIARALVTEPKIVLADEPTASLDKNTGRDVVDIIQRLAKQRGCTVILVTHDNRILDIADRIISLEDGRLSVSKGELLLDISNFFSAINDIETNQISSIIASLNSEKFADFLNKLNREFKQLLQTVNLFKDRSFNNKIDRIIKVISLKIAQVLKAEQVTFFIVDCERQELWSKNAMGLNQELISIRIPFNTGIAGYVASTGRSVNIPDPYTDPRFNRKIDLETGFRTKNILCLPIFNSQQEVFAVAQILNKIGDIPFDREDEQKFFLLTKSLGVILETSILYIQQISSSGGEKD
ncbi:ATP-binding cassette domain-containing protein [uncultured Nostoc sp.]|uniref:ATP-binding cassette domain-containing protein n=1 Tax=uncultured Nostoc sp. TaxID=340711 RepID=UPI0035CA07E4